MHSAVRTLMVLDDDRVLAYLISRVAETAGFRVRSFSDPDHFFAALRSDPPTHLAIDLLMPGMDGIEVLRQLALDGCRSAVIIISGMEPKVLEVAVTAALARGLRVSGVLAKPVRPTELLALLEAYPDRLGEGSRPVFAEVSGASLQAAMEQSILTLRLDPRITLADGRISGVEARLGMGAGADWTPVDEFDQAATPDVQDTLFERYLDSALDWFAGSNLHRSGGKMVLRLSARSLEDFRLADRIEASCHQRGIASGSLTLLVAAASAADRTADGFDTLTRLRLKGFRLGLKDFGAGYSSFVQLLRLPLSELRIDASFVGGEAHSGDAERIVDVILSLAEGMGLACVAEGVEHASMLSTLAAKGCLEALGSAVGGPQDALAMDERIIEARALRY